jgi:hypothetical protein
LLIEICPLDRKKFRLLPNGKFVELKEKDLNFPSDRHTSFFSFINRRLNTRINNTSAENRNNNSRNINNSTTTTTPTAPTAPTASATNNNNNNNNNSSSSRFITNNLSSDGSLFEEGERTGFSDYSSFGTIFPQYSFFSSYSSPYSSYSSSYSSLYSSSSTSSSSSSSSSSSESSSSSHPFLSSNSNDIY